MRQEKQDGGTLRKGALDIRAEVKKIKNFLAIPALISIAGCSIAGYEYGKLKRNFLHCSLYSSTSDDDDAKKFAHDFLEDVMQAGVSSKDKLYWLDPTARSRTVEITAYNTLSMVLQVKLGLLASAEKDIVIL